MARPKKPAAMKAPKGAPVAAPADARDVMIGGVGTVPLAGMGQRIFAGLVDVAIVGVLMIPIVAYLPPLAEIILGALIALAYFVAMLARTGQTVGARLLRIKCVSVADGEVPGLRSVLFRVGVGVLPAFVFPPYGLVVLLFIMLSPLADTSSRMQGFQDRAAGTYIVKADADSPIQPELSFI